MKTKIKNANRVTLIIYLWHFLSFLDDLWKTLERDGQEIKISTRMKKFHFLVKYTVFIKHENEVLKNSDFCYTWSNDHFQWVFQILERYNQYSRRYDILKSYPIWIKFFSIISIQHNAIAIGNDFKMQYLLVSPCISTTWWVSLLVDQRVPKAHVANFYGGLQFIRSVFRTSKFPVFKIYWNCNFVGLLHHPFRLSLFRHFWASVCNYWPITLFG